VFLPYHPLIVFHAEKPERAGLRWDFVEEHGASPVMLVLARTASEPLTRFVRRLDAELAKQKGEGAKIYAYVVMLSDDESLEKELQAFAERHRIKNINLAIDWNAREARAWKLANDADITLILYKRRKVTANHAFRQGEFDDKTAAMILDDLPKLLGKAEEPAKPPAEAHKQPADIALFHGSTLKWRAGPPSLPKGAKIAVLEGDPAKEGPFVFRIKIPDGYRVPPHTHPKTERVTVISGTFNIGMGDAFDQTATRVMPAGAFGYWPAGMKHFVWAKGETILQLHGMGPWSIKYVNPEDDPRKQKE
jgi:quercetin dioxygenase-like cupin family protein